MQHLTKPEIKLILNNIENWRNRLMVLMMFTHGLRVSEVLGLKGSDIRDNYVKVQRLKGSLKTRQPYVFSDDIDFDEGTPLSLLAKQVGDKDRLFTDIKTRNGVYKLIQRAGLKAGIPAHRLHPHALKHSCAMALIKVTGIENVRQYLGHRSISSTGEYLKVSDDIASLEAKRAF